MTGTATTSVDAARCYVCGSAAGPRRVGTNDVVVCGGCGFGQLVGTSATPDYWARNDDLDGELGERYWTTARTAVFAAALDRLGKAGGGRRLLDLGGGVGHFARCALDQGWDAYSYDVSPSATEVAAGRVGPHRALSSLPEELLGTFDAVTLWCVAAHVGDPREVVAEAVRALRPGGHLFLTTPNFVFQSGYARLLGAAGRSLDFAAHDHVMHFTKGSLRLLLRQAGLDSTSFTYVGVTEDCLLDRRLARVLVPAKRVWNGTSVWLAALGLPLLCSELQVVAAKP